MVRRLALLAGPLLAVAFGPVAHAGPLSWSYKAVVQAGDGSSVPPASAVLALSRFDSTDAAGGASAPLPTGSAGTMTGDGTIVLAAASKGVYSTGDPTGAEVSSFRTLLEITDAASGQRGFTYINGTGGLIDGLGGSGEVQLSGEGRVLIDIGQRRYDLTWHREESESVSRIVADVRVLGGVDAPEPASLALAGLGLGTVAVRRLRRK